MAQSPWRVRAHSEWRSTCCNPFNIRGHTARKNTLRPVTHWMLKKDPSILMGTKICDNCRKKLGKSSAVFDESDLDVGSFTPPDSPYQMMKEEEQEPLQLVNQCLEDLGETPVTKRKLQSKKYVETKLDHLTEKMGGLMLGERPRKSEDTHEMLDQLKEKFHSSKERSTKVQILTVLPKSWSIKKIQAEFGASNFMVRKAKQLVQEKGVLSSPDPKQGHTTPKETCDLVVTFYESDACSRCMPGKKDFVSVKYDHGRRHVQKRLILCNLRELYQLFKEKHPHQHVGFSKFAELRPKHCVLAGASGTHSVCVCTIHQNVKLMLLGAGLCDLTSSDDVPLSTYHNCLAKIICNPPLPACYLGECKHCPGIDQLKDHLFSTFDDNMIDTITYKQWTAVDRSSLETFSQHSDQFVEIFCEKLEALRSHSFIANQQSIYFDQIKMSLKPSEVVVCADFSENYAFVLQDAAQGFHWNNAQATIHPFVAYFRETDSGEILHRNFVVISECLHHDTVAVYLFQKKLIAFLKQTCRCLPKKIAYISDGAASQYKNRKNFINLCSHQADFGISAEWHFSATSHGKGACDGLGGTVKRLAARASLQRPYENQIMTPHQLYQWASTNIPGVTFNNATIDEYEHEKAQLEKRFDNSCTIMGTRQLHCFIPRSNDTLLTKRYSLAASGKVQRVSKLATDIEMEHIEGYVTCSHNNHWWLAQVMNKDIDSGEVMVNLLSPHGPSRWYKYPQTPTVLNVPLTDILTIVKPSSATGRSYSLTQTESKAAAKKLKDIRLTQL